MGIEKFWFITVIFLINILYADADGYVNIPCSEYKLDTVLVMSMKGQGLESIIRETVVSKKDNRIIVKTVTKNKIYNMEQTSIMLTYLFESNGTIYSSGEEINNGGYKIKNKNIPDVPLCGKVPTVFQYRTVSGTSMQPNGSVPQMRQTVKIHKVGIKKIKIPAGEFEAEVFQRNTKIEVLNIKNSALTKIVSTQYYANKIGAIKQDSTSAMVMPENSLLAMSKIQKNTVTIELVTY
jgi:hypothetical protein